VACCREPRALVPRKSFCAVLEEHGAGIPLYVEKTSHGVRFRVTYQGSMLDLFDAVRTYECRGVTGRAVLAIERHASVYYTLAEPLVGTTLTLGALSKLRT